jgi:hypothetical protein
MRFFALLLLLVTSAQAEPAYLLQFDVKGDASAVADPLARRLQAHGAQGDLVVGDQHLWLIATQAPSDMAAALAPGRLRFAPVVGEGGTLGSVGTPMPQIGSKQRLLVDLSQALEPEVTDVRAELDQLGGPMVMVRFDTAGAAAFHALTKTLINRKLAIVVDDRVVVAPVVREAIAGGRVMISMGHREGRVKADQLAARLRTGPLPAVVHLAVQAVGTRADADGQTRVTGTPKPLEYSTPKRWNPTACRLSKQPDCAVSVVRP